MDFEDALNGGFLQARHEILMCNPVEEQLDNADCEILPITPNTNHLARYLANFGLVKCSGLLDILKILTGLES